MKTVLLVIAPKDFQDKEYQIPKDILEQNGIEVLTASKEYNTCIGSRGTKIEPDLTIEDIGVNDFDAIIFVGGSGAIVYLDNEMLLDIIRGFNDEGKIIGAICVAPAILARSGILNGKKATISSKHRKYLDDANAEYTTNDVQVDANIVTANGPGAVCEFAEKILYMIGEV